MVIDISNDINIPVIKDESKEVSIPSIWRPVFCAIVNAFVKADYQLSVGVPSVDPISAETAKQIEEYINDYGETLIDLPQETWNTSVTQWMGNNWHVLVDLWTEGEGLSDMVLDVRVSDSQSGYLFEVYMVYVP